MQDLTDEFKLSVRSTSQTFAALTGMVTGLAVGRRVRFRGKRPTRAAVVNGAILYLASLPADEWERAIALGLRRLESFLEQAPPAEPAEREASGTAGVRRPRKPRPAAGNPSRSAASKRPAHRKGQQG